METKSLTHAELGAALGIMAASAKWLAIRHGWHKVQGNDGKARVAVPIESLDVEQVTGDRQRLPQRRGGTAIGAMATGGRPGSGFLRPTLPPVKPVALSIRSTGKLIATSIQVVLH